MSRLFVMIACCHAIAWSALGADQKFSIRAVELVGADAALVGELHQPALAWEAFQQSELFQRVSQSRVYRQFLDSPSWRNWQELFCS